MIENNNETTNTNTTPQTPAAKVFNFAGLRERVSNANEELAKKILEEQEKAAQRVREEYENTQWGEAFEALKDTCPTFGAVLAFINNDDTPEGFKAFLNNKPIEFITRKRRVVTEGGEDLKIAREQLNALLNQKSKTMSELVEGLKALCPDKANLIEVDTLRPIMSEHIEAGNFAKLGQARGVRYFVPNTSAQTHAENALRESAKNKEDNK